MRKLALTLLATVALLLAACGSGSVANTPPTDTPVPPAPTATATAVPPTATSGPSAPTITMASRSFSGNSATVKAGQAVTFDDPAATGGVHNLVTGSNGTFKAEAGAPSQFASATGVSFAPGTSMDIVFPTAGTYTITCTIHPTMEATITVTA